MRLPKFRNIAPAAFTVVAVAVALALLARPLGAIFVVTHGVNAEIRMIQATAGARDTYDFDPKIPADIKSELIAMYKHKYMKYTFVNSTTKFFSWGQADATKKKGEQGDRVDIDIPGGRVLNVRLLGYKLPRGEIHFQFQLGATFSMPDIMTGTHYIMKVSDDPDPVIMVFTPALVQSTK